MLFRLSEGAALPAFLSALDTASATPPPLALALGGPEVGDVGEVVVRLTPGRYVLGCVRRGSQGHRHASTGEAKLLVVTSAAVTLSRKSPPPATQQLRLVDFAYVGPDRWPAGSHLLRVENGGRQEHQLRLALLRPGASVQDWMKAAGSGAIATNVAGVARMGPGAVAYLPVELAAGDLCRRRGGAGRRCHRGNLGSRVAGGAGESGNGDANGLTRVVVIYLGSFTVSFTRKGTPSVIHFGAGAPSR